MDLWLLGGLVGGADAGEVLDLTGAGLLVEALRVALLGLLDGDVDEDLDEGEGRVGVVGLLVQGAGLVAVGLVGRDEGGQGEAGRVGKELCDLSHSKRQNLISIHLARTQPRGQHTSAMRRMFSLRLFSSKPRSLFRPKRTLSPSRR